MLSTDIFNTSCLSFRYNIITLIYLSNCQTATKGHENLVAACPAGKPFEWEAFRGYGFAGRTGSNSKKIFSDEVL
ncbi:MAG: hypothetical protein A2073_07170 [Deltaproteobacteria bacterium GWC2_42_11]|nr:MAG: hypothetical protein A2073_07170 [Deltaproteobacteria bacterium GWC2_42_11]